MIPLDTLLIFAAAWVLLAGGISRWFTQRPLWLKMQRWMLGGAFGALAAWLAFDTRQT